jgi:hypothetical protein
MLLYNGNYFETLNNCSQRYRPLFFQPKMHLTYKGQCCQKLRGRYSNTEPNASDEETVPLLMNRWKEVRELFAGKLEGQSGKGHR